MKLIEIFDQLQHGEFRQLAIGGAKAGEIEEKNFPAIAALVNLGLTALYTRFILKEGQIVLRPVLGQQTYLLDSKYSVNARRSTEPVRYLIDEPSNIFDADTVIKIERVLDAEGNEHNLNLQGGDSGFFTPSMRSLRIPKDYAGNVTLVYRQNHPQLTPSVGSFDPCRLEIELPHTHLEALLYHVAARGHNPVGMVNEFNMGNNYSMKFEQACILLEQKNMQMDTGTENVRAINNGWV